MQPNRHCDFTGIEGEFETHRMRLHRPRRVDFPHWAQFFCSDRAEFVGGGFKGEATLAWRIFAIFMGHWELHGAGPYVLEVPYQPEPVGAVGLWYPLGWPYPELTWAIWTDQHEGKGLASEAVAAVRSRLLSAVSETPLVSYIHPNNHASIRLAERLGCQRVALEAPDHEPTIVYRHVANGGRDG